MNNQSMNIGTYNRSNDYLAMAYGSNELIYTDEPLKEETPSQYISQSNVTSGGHIVSQMFVPQTEGKAFSPSITEQMPINNDYSEAYLEIMYGNCSK